jgi:hypothetical protein
VRFGELKHAGTEQKDSLGRVVHFHSFRKTGKAEQQDSKRGTEMAQTNYFEYAKTA